MYRPTVYCIGTIWVGGVESVAGHIDHSPPWNNTIYTFYRSKYLLPYVSCTVLYLYRKVSRQPIIKQFDHSKRPATLRARWNDTNIYNSTIIPYNTFTAERWIFFSLYSDLHCGRQYNGWRKGPATLHIIHIPWNDTVYTIYRPYWLLPITLLLPHPKSVLLY
jgi:hypothetical protein